MFSAVLLAQPVLVVEDLLVAESAAAQFELGPLQLAAALPLEHFGRQIPGGRGNQERRHLPPHLLLLMVDQLPLEILLDGVTQIPLGFAFANSLSNSGVSSGGASFLTSRTSIAAERCLPRTRSFGAPSAI